MCGRDFSGSDMSLAIPSCIAAEVEGIVPVDFGRNDVCPGLGFAWDPDGCLAWAAGLHVQTHFCDFPIMLQPSEETWLPPGSPPLVVLSTHAVQWLAMKAIVRSRVR